MNVWCENGGYWKQIHEFPNYKEYKFSIIELGLYLDTHPEDEKALCLHNKYSKELKELKDAYQKVYGEEIILPRYIAEEYTIPTPIKDGDVFIGWFDNSQATGTALTVLPVGWKGTVYAIWESTSTSVENVRWELDQTAPMYDLLGRQVGQDYRGIVIQNGRKYIK